MMNDLSGDNDNDKSSCLFHPTIPRLAIYLVLGLFLLGLSVSVLILVVVHNPSIFLLFLFLSSLVLCFLAWNSRSFRRKVAIFHLLRSSPDSDLAAATEGQLVKVTGRFSTDFCITDHKSGIRAVVKAGAGCKVVPLIVESKLVTTTGHGRMLSPPLKRWLQERNLSDAARLLRLEEGYVQEGNFVTVVGMLRKDNSILTIVEPQQLFSTGCFWRKLVLPMDVDGLILGVPSTCSTPEAAPG